MMNANFDEKWIQGQILKHPDLKHWINTTIKSFTQKQSKDEIIKTLETVLFCCTSSTAQHILELEVEKEKVIFLESLLKKLEKKTYMIS